MDTKAFEITHPKITCLSFKPGSAYLVAGDSSGSFRQWRVHDGVHVNMWTMNTLGQSGYPGVVLTDGRWIVSTNDKTSEVAVWSTETRERVIQVAKNKSSSDVCALDISSDSTRFAFGSTDGTTLIFDISSGTRFGRPLRDSDWNSVVDGVKLSPDASRAALAIRSQRQVAVYDVHSGKYLFGIAVPDQTYGFTSTSLAWSLDGQQLYVASKDKITCCDMSTSSRTQSEWPIHDNARQPVSIVPHGKFIACSAGLSVSFWDPASRQQIGHTIDHAAGMNVTCIAISHDARYLACAHGKGITVHHLEGYIPRRYLPVTLWLPLMCVSTAVLKSWIQGNPTEAEVILSEEIAQPPNPARACPGITHSQFSKAKVERHKASSAAHDALASRALIRTHLGEYRTALEDAETSLKIKQSPIGQIARSLALVGVGEQEVALDDLVLVFYDYDPSDDKCLLLVNTIFLFVCNKRKQAISRLLRFLDGCDEKMQDIYLQVLGMMYLKQRDYGNAIQTLGSVKRPFTTEDRGPLMTIFIIFNWNFENLKFIAWQRACEKLYASGSMKEVEDTLLKMVGTLPEDEKEPTQSRILQEIINRSGEVTLLAWTGKSSTCNSCLPNSPAVYAHTLPSLALEGEELRKRIAELRTSFTFTDALVAYKSVTRLQPVRFAHFRLHLPCIVFRVKTLGKEHENVYRAETAGLGDVEFTTADLLPLNEPRKLVFVNPWIHHLPESRDGVAGRDEDDRESSVGLDTYTGSGGDADIELVHEPMIEEVLPVTPPTSDADAHTRALQLIARLGQPFSALLLLKQPDGAYKRVAADHEIVIGGVRDDVLRDLRVEVLELL